MLPFERFMFFHNLQRKVFSDSLGNLLNDVNFFESLLICLVNTPPQQIYNPFLVIKHDEIANSIQLAIFQYLKDILFCEQPTRGFTVPH